MKAGDLPDVFAIIRSLPLESGGLAGLVFYWSDSFAAWYTALSDHEAMKTLAMAA